MFKSHLMAARILAVDDNSDQLLLLRTVFEAQGFASFRGESDSTKVPQILATWQPDLIILDLEMPGLNGLQIMRELKQLQPDADSRPPVMVITGYSSASNRLKVLQCGAIDVISKPFDPEELICRGTTYLSMRQLSLKRNARARRLEDMVEERTTALLGAQLEILQRLASACELRDDDTGKHTERVGDLSYRIACELGLKPDTCEVIRHAAPLHDVGKVGIPDAILLKPGKLDVQEFAVMQTHTTLGAKLLANADSELVQLAATIAVSHHEKWNGTGYPAGSKGDAIPMPGRIVAIADVFDALTHERPYKHAMDEREAIQLIREGAGIHFDPAVVEAFLKVQVSSAFPGDTRSAARQA